MNANTATRRIIHQVKGSSAVRGWAWERDVDGEGGWLAVMWNGSKEPSPYHFNSWTPGLLLAAEQEGRSVGRLVNSLLGRGDLAKARQDRGVEVAPGFYRGEA